MANDAHDREPEVDPFPADPWELVPGSVTSIGEYLKKQRQLRGISQAELCKLTRIPPRSLERLESGAFDALDDGFVRGFVRTVADALGLDPDDTLARMSPEPESTGERASRGPSPGVLRVGILVAAVALILVSVGLVRTALDAFPGPQETSATIVRKDPVRALAEAEGVGVVDGTEVLVPIPARDSTPPAEEAPPTTPVMRADAELEGAPPSEVTPSAPTPDP